MTTVNPYEAGPYGYSTTGISFTFEHRGTTYKYDGYRASNDEFKDHFFVSTNRKREESHREKYPKGDIGKMLKFLGDLDGGDDRGCTVNFTYDIEKDDIGFYDFGCDYNPPGGNVCEYPEPYEDMDKDDIDKIKINYKCDLQGAFQEAFKKHWSSKISQKFWELCDTDDDERQMPKLHHKWVQSDKATREIIDDTLIHVCGYSMGTLVKKALGVDSVDEDDDDK